MSQNLQSTFSNEHWENSVSRESNSEDKNLAMALIQMRHGSCYSQVNSLEHRQQQLWQCIQDLKLKLLMSRSENYLLRGFIQTTNIVARKKNDIDDDDIHNLLKTIKGDYFLKDVSVQTTPTETITVARHPPNVHEMDGRLHYQAARPPEVHTIIVNRADFTTHVSGKKRKLMNETRTNTKECRIEADNACEKMAMQPPQQRIISSKEIDVQVRDARFDPSACISRVKMEIPASTCSLMPINLKQHKNDESVPLDLIRHRVYKREESVRSRCKEVNDEPRLLVSYSPQPERTSVSPIVQRVSSPSPTRMTNETVHNAPQDNLARCKICSSSFGSEKALKIHLAKKHKESQKKLDRPTVLECPCGKIFKTKWPQNCINKLKCHGNKCKAYLQNAFNCEECGEKFIKLNSLYYHALKKHNIPIPVPVDSRPILPDNVTLVGKVRK